MPYRPYCRYWSRRGSRK